MTNKEKRKIMNMDEIICSEQESSTRAKNREEYSNNLKPYVREDAQNDFMEMLKIAYDIEDLKYKMNMMGDEHPTESDLIMLDNYSKQSKEIYFRNTDSGWPFDFIYMYIIDGIQVCDLEKVNIDEVAEQAGEIYEKTDNKIAVVESYIDILFFLSLAQKDRNETDKLEATIDKMKKVIESSAYDRIKFFVKWIIEYVCDYEYFEYDEQMESDEKEKLQRESNQKEFNNVVYVACELIFKLVDINPSERAEYELLIKSLEKFKLYPEAIFIIMNIYQCVEEIKYQLAVKDVSKYKFGHYTRGSVLQIFLKQEDSKASYEISGRTRLYNVRYMNDPEEGKIIDKILGLRDNNNPGDKVESSPWFLMSLTTALDELTMWSQYGENAEGVCIELKPDSFSKVNSIIDIKPFRYQLPSSEKTKTMLNAKECLYRICYLDYEALKKGEIVISELHNELLKDDDVINRVTNSLVQMKEILAFSYQLNHQIEEELLYDVNKLLEEIRYLFKSSGYYYEKEIRLLKYSELKPDSDEIKVHSMSPAAKLYIERESPIQINKIIFGPKFKEPENVTPLVHLLDNEIICVRSSQKFK
jgi:hypothetical protein